MKIYFPQLMGIFFSFGLMASIIELVRRRKLREEYSAFWLFIGVALLVLSIFKGILKKLTTLIGFPVPIITILFLGILFLLGLSLYLSVRLSKIQNDLISLAQDFAILSENVEKGHLEK